MSPGARLFLAVDPPASVCEQLAGWGRGARGAAPAMRALPAASLHITLCFLGMRPLGEVEAIGGAALGCARPVPDLELGAPVWLPPRRPRLLAVELHDPEGKLAALQGDVATAVSEAVDWEPEVRRYRPHITVARMPEQRGRHRRELLATPAARFAAEGLTLYRSWLGRGGAEYEALASVVLG